MPLPTDVEGLDYSLFGLPFADTATTAQDDELNDSLFGLPFSAVQVGGGGSLWDSNNSQQYVCF